MMFSDIPQQTALSADVDYVTLVAGKAATETLMRGFTSVRDVSGPTISLKRTIDEGVLPGPRIWPAGALDSSTHLPHRTGEHKNFSAAC